MAHNPQAAPGQQEHDPAGSTQMFRAFVDDTPESHDGPAAPTGPRIGVMLGVAGAITVLAVVAWLAFS